MSSATKFVFEIQQVLKSELFYIDPTKSLGVKRSIRMPVVWILALFLMATPAMSQMDVSWEMLEDVEFEDKFSEEIDAYYFYPHFGKSVKKLDKKEIVITGYMLPIDAAKGIYILSRNPFSACFFCGNSGPESVIELDFKGTHRKFKNDEIITLKGTFILNQDDMYKCNYILEEALEVKD